MQFRTFFKLRKAIVGCIKLNEGEDGTHPGTHFIRAGCERAASNELTKNSRFIPLLHSSVRNFRRTQLTSCHTTEDQCDRWVVPRVYELSRDNTILYEGFRLTFWHKRLTTTSPNSYYKQGKPHMKFGRFLVPCNSACRWCSTGRLSPNLVVLVPVFQCPAC